MQGLTNTMQGVLTLVALVTLVAAPAEAAELVARGRASYVTIWNDTVRQMDGRSLVRFEQKGVLHDADATSPLDNANHDCAGGLVMSERGEPGASAGHCMAIDGDGDAWWLWWISSGPTGAWGVYAGTGKYEGATGGGTITVEADMPDRDSIAYEGTIMLK